MGKRVFGEMTKGISGFHKSEAKEVLPIPEVGVVNVLVVSGQADSPNAIHWASFNDYSFTGGLQ